MFWRDKRISNGFEALAFTATPSDYDTGINAAANSVMLDEFDVADKLGPSGGR